MAASKSSATTKTTITKEMHDDDVNIVDIIELAKAISMIDINTERIENKQLTLEEEDEHYINIAIKRSEMKK
jgi:hypothetical protein